MITNRMSYREAVPSEKTKLFALAFWELTVTGEISGSFSHEVFPDGCLNLVYCRNAENKTIKKLLMGIALKTVSFDLRAGDVFWGMRISPIAARRFLGFDPMKFITQPVELLPSTALKFFSPVFDNLDDCRNFTDAVEVSEKALKAISEKLPETDSRLGAAVEILLKTGGQAKISEVAARINLSVRQFERNFRRHSGITPKQYARICRIRATAVNLVENVNSDWASRAAEIGFTDQSHLCRELNSMTGGTPISFAKTITRIEHGEIIK